MGVEVKSGGEGGCNDGCCCNGRNSGWGSGWGAVGGALVGGGFGAAAVSVWDKINDTKADIQKVESTVQEAKAGIYKDISDAAKAQYKVDIDKKKIEIKEPLKTLGVHDVLVRVHPEITSTIKVNVVAE